MFRLPRRPEERVAEVETKIRTRLAAAFIVVLAMVAASLVLRPLCVESGTETAGHVLSRLDADGDGRVSGAEFGSRGKPEGFARYDANHDGFITVDEIEKAFLEEDPETVASQAESPSP